MVCSFIIMAPGSFPIMKKLIALFWKEEVSLFGLLPGIIFSVIKKQELSLAKPLFLWYQKKNKSQLIFNSGDFFFKILLNIV